MTSPARSSRTQTQLAGINGRGVGAAQAVIDETNLDVSLDDVDLTIEDAGGYFATDTAAAHIANINKYAPYLAQKGSDLVIDSDSSGGGNGVGATPATTGVGAPVRAALTYLVEARIIVTATTNGGVELSFTAPTGATMAWHASIFQAAGNIVEEAEDDINGALNYIAAALSFDHIDIIGTLVMDTTAGSLTLFAAQDTAHADNTIIHGESWMRVSVMH